VISDSLLLRVEVVNGILSFWLNLVHVCELNRRYDLFRNRKINALIIQDSAHIKMVAIDRRIKVAHMDFLSHLWLSQLLSKSLSD
jgi:hypothetical protein